MAVFFGAACLLNEIAHKKWLIRTVLLVLMEIASENSGYCSPDRPKIEYAAE